MLTGIRQTAVVKPGGLIELHSTELTEGTTVEVIVLVEPETSHRPLTSFIGTASGSFATSGEADKFIRQERDAWDS